MTDGFTHQSKAHKKFAFLIISFFFPLLSMDSRSSNGASSSRNNTSNFYNQFPSFSIQNASWPFFDQTHTQKQQQIYPETPKKLTQK